MTERHRESLDELRKGREDTLALVADLGQQQLDTVPGPGRWSLGEILDHLVRADEMLTKEIRVLEEKSRRGDRPFVYRSLRDVGAPFGWLPLPLRLPLEAGLVGWNMAVPPVVREWIMGQRQLRVKASEVLRPEAGRPAKTLCADLRLGVSEIERLVEQPAPDGAGLDGVVYYSPIAGFNGVDGLIRLIARHERRHQEQIREVMAALSLSQPSQSANEDR